MHFLVQKGVFMLSKWSCSDSSVPMKMRDFQATIFFLILASTLKLLWELNGMPLLITFV